MSGRVRRNQFGEEVIGEDKYLTLDNWNTVWEKGRTKFHKDVVHPSLIKFFPRILDGREGSLSIFLPLSGKSLDLKWLADQGHRAIGNEISPIGCAQFFNENGLEFETVDMDGVEGKCFKSKDSQCDVSIYCCDFFCLTRDILGHVDGIWDRGSFVAINTKDRQKYSEVIDSIASEDTRYLLNTFTVDHTVFAGPPFTTDEEEIKTLFGNCRIEMLEARDVITQWQRDWGLTEFIQTDYLITKNK